MEQENEWTTVIESRTKFFQLNIGEVIRYRDLIKMFVKRAFTLSYKQTILGPVWLLIKPVFAALMYTLVFSNIAHISTDGAPAMLFYMMGNAMWTYFASCLGSNAGTFTENAGIFGKVYFPRLVTPISNVFVNLLNFGISMTITIIIGAVYMYRGENVNPKLALLLVPLLVVELGMLGMGCGIIVSSMTTKYRDLSVLVGFGMQLWMYATPVVYPVSQIPEKYQSFMMINPVAPIMETFRYAFLGTGHIPILWLCISIAVTGVIFLFGILIFNQVERTFMDTV